MRRVALVAVDSGLTVVGSRGHVSAPSPGLALIDGHDLLVGEDARRNARLKPRWVHSRFWQSPSTEPLKRPFPHHLRSADLIHAHLADFWRGAGGDADEVILVVPGVYTREQLALLLGIAEAAGISVRGLVDLGVAAAADRDIRGRCFHLDLHLHRAVLTEIENRRNVVRGRVWETEGVGLTELYDLWARRVARLFVRQTRFDPLHLAATEQALYLELPRHIAALTELEATQIAIDSGGHRHAIDLQRSEMIDITREVTALISDWIGRVADVEGSSLLLSHNVAPVPGLADRLRETADCEIAILHPAAAGSTALGHAGDIVSHAGGLPLVTRLPSYDARPPGPVTVPVTPPTGVESGGAGPTHLVIDGVALPITEEPSVIPLSPSPESGGVDLDIEGQVTIRRIGARVVFDAPPGTAVVVNGQRVESSSVVSTGDRIHVGEPPREIILVTMVG